MENAGGGYFKGQVGGWGGGGTLEGIEVVRIKSVAGRPKLLKPARIPATVAKALCSTDAAAQVQRDVRA